MAAREWRDARGVSGRPDLRRRVARRRSDLSHLRETTPRQREVDSGTSGGRAAARAAFRRALDRVLLRVRFGAGERPLSALRPGRVTDDAAGISRETSAQASPPADRRSRAAARGGGPGNRRSELPPRARAPRLRSRGALRPTDVLRPRQVAPRPKP